LKEKKDIKKIGRKKMIYSKIKKITKKSTRKVYDIVGMPNGNFVCNRAVISNCDEAIRFASSADWNKKENKELKKKLAQVRTKHLFYILCFPLKIYKLEKTYLESYVNYWCLTGDTKITTKDINGQIRYTPLKDLNKRNPEILTYNKELDIFEFKKYSKKIKTKKNAEVFEIELINGLKIKATNDHLFLTQKGYIQLKDLKENDKIKIKTKKCKGCGKDFIPKKQSMIWCSKKCKSLLNEYKENSKKYQKDYREKNKDELKRKGKIKYNKNRNIYLIKAKDYREKNKENIRRWMLNRRKKNPEYVRKLDNEWRKKNHAHVIKKGQERWKRRMKNDVPFKLRVKLGNQLKAKLKAQNEKKQNSALKYLGCSLEYFKKYLELKFKEGMSWPNHGIRGWHIDHIKPCAKFDLTKESEIKKCFHYTNMQPLWWRENLIKSDKYEE